MRRFLAISMLCLGAWASLALAQEPAWNAGDSYWSNNFALPRVNGRVFCSFEYQGALVIGGAFDQIGDVDAANLAVWDGAAWSELGGGTDGPVYALAGTDGGLIVGGTFAHAGGVTAQGVARWNGTGWEAFGAGLGTRGGLYGGGSGVHALAIYGGAIVAGGDFIFTGSLPLLHLARWDGASWRPLTTMIDNDVLALAVVSDTLYAGGRFAEIDGTFTGPLARWDGQRWSAMGQEFQPRYSYYGPEIRALLPFQGRLIAGGAFGDYGTNQVAAWNGASWDTLAQSSSDVSSLASRGDTLYVGADDGLHTWPVDPNGWWTYFRGSVRSLSWSGPDLVAAVDGEVRGPGSDSVLAVSLAVRRASGWTPLIPWRSTMHGLTLGDYGRVRAFEVYRDELLALGDFREYGDPPRWGRANSLAAWNGSTWRAFPMPSVLGLFPTCLLADGDTLYMGGPSYESPSTVLRYDGMAWTPLDSLPIRVNAMVRYRGSIYAAGDRWQPGVYPSDVYRLSNGHWERVGTSAGIRGGTIQAMAVAGDQLVVAGLFDGIENVAAPSIAAWDGSHWHALGSVGSSYYGDPLIVSLAVYRGMLIAAADGYGYGQAVITWDGTTWKPLGGIYASPKTIASVGGELFLGGQIGISPLSRPDGIVHWTGREWERMGSGVNGAVLALKGYRGSLFVGGDFRRAGSHPAYAVAQWDRLRETLGAPRAALAPSAPNPFRTTTAVRYRLQVASGVHISISDVRGRKVRVLEHAWRDAGEHSVAWDGRDDDGRTVGSGVYYVQLRIGDEVRTSQKIVLLR